MTEQENACPTGARNETDIKNLKDNFDKMSEKIEQIFKELKGIREEMSRRMPNWATFTLSTLMGLVGFLGANCIHLLRR